MSRRARWSAKLHFLVAAHTAAGRKARTGSDGRTPGASAEGEIHRTRGGSGSWTGPRRPNGQSPVSELRGRTQAGPAVSVPPKPGRLP